ncbi:ras-related protein Rab-24 [Nomia melanderi]|uniref:ras-related protein Rab-24 n=1 Tax=Nomia melanderi TaxID=2448451 RepID=UPI001304568D|nr:ras-related protein Rab-24-like [Nomia melanderi]
MNRVDLKVVLLGDASVGKTSLVRRYKNGTFTEEIFYQGTIGAAYVSKKIEHNDKSFIMGIWDTAGGERYDAMTKIYYRGAKAAVVCYDITNLKTFQRAKFWIRELRVIEDACKIYICATKKDLLELGAIANPDIDVVETYAKGVQAKFFTTSSKTGENVDELFNVIAYDFIVDNPSVLNEREAINISTEPEKRSHCCS